MFIIKRLPKKSLAAALVMLFVCLLLVMRFTVFNFSPTTAYCDTVGKYNLEITDSFTIKDFFNQFGLEINEESVEQVNITIPSEFNDVYQKYNDLQNNQGLDLEHYKGFQAVRYTYSVDNYPTDAQVRANVIVCNNKVIAGDLCTVALNGVMTTLDDKTIEQEQE